MLTLASLFQITNRAVLLHNVDNIICLELYNGMSYTIMLKDESIYLLSLVSKFTYDNKVDNLPLGYIKFRHANNGSYSYIGKELPMLLSTDIKETETLLHNEFLALSALKVSYALGKVIEYKIPEPSLT